MSILSNDLKADWQLNHPIYMEAYQSGRSSFITNLLPQFAMQFSVYQTLEMLHKRLGNETLRRALDPVETIASPVKGRPDGEWMKRSNMIGVNVRTTGSFWQVVNYVLTLPASHDSIHLLPIWEPGVVGSLYGMVSWQINPEFFDVDLARFVPALDTVEKQLKVVMNLLHAMGRTVGMDVIPHTDRFSEMVLACPSLFEWVQRDGDKINDHSSLVYKYVEEAIWQYLKYVGAADGTPITFAKDVFFSTELAILTDDQRSRILFGHFNDYGGRLQRRINLIRHLTAQGLETLPMTMAPPYRGIHIDPTDFIVDEYGQTWYQYAFDEPQLMSRVFGPLARYRFYESKDNNQNWELDFDRPNYPAWAYICQKVHECQQTYNFDFMRGDMAHVQMRPAGVPEMIGHYYDPLRAIKRYVRGNGSPHFAFFAETFLAPPDVMGYGDELDHLDAIEAESTLGDLQSLVVGSEEFNRQFSAYYDYLKTRRFAPNFTVISADKDDPRFDEFYQTGNLFRYFTALFLTDMPSYIGLGFELRNLHDERGTNEEYSKLYVFQIEDDRQPDKVTHGPYEWGQNVEQFKSILRIRTFAERIWPVIAGQETRWLVAPDAQSTDRDFIAWTHTGPTGYVFAAAYSDELPDTIPELEQTASMELVFEEGGCRIWHTIESLEG
ncbi:alpha-amylase family protein [Spirosoma endbachense]|uniref:Alpha-amylase n=1 Tax=Spirosoma endbachense TaxID=2666025 RepID=A0A6P1W3B0_9BACT|nr:hypothetical protein [Spirosoma endbachense]QHV99535.1 hypothetical protein GJR95_32995 [Spirosoma endbachense]